MLQRHLFQYMGHIGCYTILGGWDPVDGPSLWSVQAHGSVLRMPYLTLGSGSMAALSVLLSQWHAELTRDEAVALACNAIHAGIVNDMGSGSNR